MRNTFRINGNNCGIYSEVFITKRHFSIGMFEKVLVEQNPHWEGKKPETGIPRTLLTTILSFLENKQVLIITGIRRAGKSYLQKQLLAHLLKTQKPQNILYLNLENPYFEEYRDKAITLEKIFEEYLALTDATGTIYLLLDEVQFFTHWQVFVKAKYEMKKVKFILTGSNAWLLSSEFITMLSGRCFTFELFPFHFREFLSAKNISLFTKRDVIAHENNIKKSCTEYIEWGGFPDVVLASSLEEKKELLTMYYKNIVFQDVIPRFQISNFRETEELTHYLLSNTGKIFSYHRLSTLVNLSDKTIKEYIKYFSQAYLLFEVCKYDPSLRKQLLNPKKVYSGDVGLSMIHGFHFSPDRGRALENIVFLELKRRGKMVYYYNKHGECDFVVKDGSRVINAIQVCERLTEDNKDREITGIREVLQEHGLTKGTIITREQEDVLHYGKYTILVLPLWKWLLQD